jgi:hypothetical protein
VAHLHLAIDMGSDPIAGSVAARGERPRQFSGWIDLVEAIEDARSTAAPDSNGAAVRAKTLGSFPGAKRTDGRLT